MNAEKLKRLQAQVRIGGKGTPRRKKKVTHQTAATDDKKLQSSLKKLSVSTIPGIEEVNIIKDDLTVIHFNNPKAQASLSANTFAVTGHGETKKVVEMLPEILPQLGQETVVKLRMFANSMSTNQNQKSKQANSASEDLVDEVPLLVDDFDQIAKQEATTESKTKPNTKAKNKSKPTTEATEQKKLESVPKSDQKPDIIEPKELKIEEKLKTVTEKQAPIGEEKNQAIDKKEVANDTETEKTKEQQNQDTILKAELKAEQAPASLDGNNQIKTNTIATDDMKMQKHKNKKDVQTPSKNKESSKDLTQNESQQSNKKNQSTTTNKNLQQDNTHNEVQQQKKNQNAQQKSTESKETSMKETAPEEKVVQIIASGEKVGDVPTRENVEPKKSDHVQGQSQQEKNSLEEIKTPSNIIKSTVEEQKSAIKDLALPLPPLIPPKLSMPNSALPQTEPKVDATSLDSKSMPNLDTTENETRTNATTIVAIEDNQAVENSPNSVIPVEKKKIPGNTLDSSTVNNETSKVGAAEATILPATKAENQSSLAKGEQQKTPQQKIPGAAKPQPNQKQVSSKEPAKPSTPQQQKQANDPKKSQTYTENKKDNEAAKGKNTTIKLQPASNNAAKNQPAQQQQTQKTPVTTQAPSKPIEKPVTVPKPANPPKSAPITKKTIAVPLTAANSKQGGASPDNKNKTNPTASKPKAQTTQSTQKTGKPRTNSGSTAAKPQQKTAGDGKSVTPPTNTNQ